MDGEGCGLRRGGFNREMGDNGKYNRDNKE